MKKITSAFLALALAVSLFAPAAVADQINESKTAVSFCCPKWMKAAKPTFPNPANLQPMQATPAVGTLAENPAATPVPAAPVAAKAATPVAAKAAAPAAAPAAALAVKLRPLSLNPLSLPSRLTLRNPHSQLNPRNPHSRLNPRNPHSRLTLRSLHSRLTPRSPRSRLTLRSLPLQQPLPRPQLRQPPPPRRTPVFPLSTSSPPVRT